jgi:hypothetical protein
MTNQHLITPPQELVRQWIKECDQPDDPRWQEYEQDIATRAAQWGADQELEACVEWLGDAPVVYNDNGDLHPGSYLRDARRPKPPSLKKQALALIDDCTDPEGDYLDDNALSIIRRALEALPDD